MRSLHREEKGKKEVKKNNERVFFLIGIDLPSISAHLETRLRIGTWPCTYYIFFYVLYKSEGTLEFNSRFYYYRNRIARRLLLFEKKK